jgi:hypothetical protein
MQRTATDIDQVKVAMQQTTVDMDQVKVATQQTAIDIDQVKVAMHQNAIDVDQVKHLSSIISADYRPLPIIFREATAGKRSQMALPT